MVAVSLKKKKKKSINSHGKFFIEGYEANVLPNSSEYIAIFNLTNDVIKALGLNTSFFSIDLINSNNELFIIECGNLLDCKIERLLYHSGVNIYETAIHSFSKSHSFTFNNNITYKYKFATLRFMYSEYNGRLQIKQNFLDNNIIIEWERIDKDNVIKPSSIADILGFILKTDNNPIPFTELKEINTSKIYYVI